MSNDAVSHPKHYTSHPSGIECIQVTEHMGFNLGKRAKLDAALAQARDDEMAMIIIVMGME